MYKTILLSVKTFLDLWKSSCPSNSTLKSRHDPVGYVFKSNRAGTAKVIWYLKSLKCSCLLYKIMSHLQITYTRQLLLCQIISRLIIAHIMVLPYNNTIEWYWHCIVLFSIALGRKTIKDFLHSHSFSPEYFWPLVGWICGVDTMETEDQHCLLFGLWGGEHVFKKRAYLVRYEA